MNVYTLPVGFIGTNCYVVTDEKNGCAVIDPGDQAEKIIAFLESKNLTPQIILLTHGHYDHIGGVKALIQRFGCKLAIGEHDADQLSDRRKSLAYAPGMTDDGYCMTPDELLKDGQDFQVGELNFRVVETPGHTQGDVVYLCGDVMFSGDTLFAGDIGRCDLPGGDYKTMLKSLKKLDALTVNYKVLPGHGPDSTLEQERLHNQYMRMVREG